VQHKGRFVESAWPTTNSGRFRTERFAGKCNHLPLAVCRALFRYTWYNSDALPRVSGRDPVMINQPGRYIPESEAELSPGPQPHEATPEELLQHFVSQGAGQSDKGADRNAKLSRRSNLGENWGRRPFLDAGIG
jgi:hypothetical protein